MSRAPTPPAGDVEHLQRLATLGTLAASSAHEVNNVITHLLACLRRAGSAAEVLRDDGTAPDSLTALEDALRSSVACCDRLRQVARGMTSCARAGDDEATLLSVRDAIDEAIVLVSPDLQHHGTVHFDLSADLPPVRANLGKLTQVFVNLLVNAMHALESADGTRTITVATRASDGFVYVDVTDTGCGIAPEFVSRVFDPFFTTRADGGGTGLGLSVSYDIVRAFGGDISVVSDLGNGTTFTVRLPQAGANRL